MPPLIVIKTRIPARFQAALERGWTPQVGADVLTAVDEGLTSRNFRNVFKTRQGSWAPLSPAYKAWKARNGFGGQTWKLTGRTMKSLTTPIKITTAGGKEWSRVVRVTRNDMRGVEATWTIEAPAAGGYFEKNNVARELMTVLESGRADVQRAVTAVVSEWVKRMGLRGRVTVRRTG